MNATSLPVHIRNKNKHKLKTKCPSSHYHSLALQSLCPKYWVPILHNKSTGQHWAIATRCCWSFYCFIIDFHVLYFARENNKIRNKPRKHNTKQAISCGFQNSNDFNFIFFVFLVLWLMLLEWVVKRISVRSVLFSTFKPSTNWWFVYF